MSGKISKSTYFHIAPIPLGTGSTVLPGNFYRLRSKFEHHWNVRHIEEVFETVRTKHFSGLPSRRSCVFLCETEDDARAFALSDNRFRDILYEVALTDPNAKVHKADYGLVRANESPAIYEALARQYWTAGHSQNIEVLADCPVEIVRCVGPIIR